MSSNLTNENPAVENSENENPAVENSENENPTSEPLNKKPMSENPTTDNPFNENETKKNSINGSPTNGNTTIRNPNNEYSISEDPTSEDQTSENPTNEDPMNESPMDDNATNESLTNEDSMDENDSFNDSTTTENPTYDNAKNETPTNEVPISEDPTDEMATKDEKPKKKYPDPSEFKKLIHNVAYPLLLRNYNLNWKCFQLDGGLEEWCRNLDAATTKNGDEPIKREFERMSINACGTPHWERKRQKVKMTATEFYKTHNDEEQEFWTAWNYVRNTDLPQEAIEGIDFSSFGFPNAKKDFTLWMGSKQSNTPCHYDTFGCNIIVQVYGNKSWIVFPPETSFNITRIPYEESSVYCAENIYAPNCEEVEILDKFKYQAFRCILEPNDVLIVPLRWWHYVEVTSSISLSVNTWIPLEKDLDGKLEEAIGKYIMQNLTSGTRNVFNKFVLNPNHWTDFYDDKIVKIIEHLVKELEIRRKKDAAKQYPPKRNKCVYGYHTKSIRRTEKILQDYRCFETIRKMKIDDYLNYINTNAQRQLTADEDESDNERPISRMEEILINGICCPKVLKVIKKEILKKYATT